MEQQRLQTTPTTSRSDRDEQLQLLKRPEYAWRVMAGDRRTKLLLLLQEGDDRADADVIAMIAKAIGSKEMTLVPVWPGDLIDLGAA